MLKKIKSLFFKTSEEETAEVQVAQTIDKTCASLIIEVALADKVFDESEINLLKNIKGIGTVELTTADVLRHRLVSKIITAFDKYAE